MPVRPKRWSKEYISSMPALLAHPAIRVVDGTVEVISEGLWKLITP